MNLLFSIDANYYHQFRAVLNSLRHHDPESLFQIYILHTNLSQDQINGLHQEIQASNIVLNFLFFIPPLDASVLFYRSGHIKSLATYARIFLADFLPLEVEKVLYLDCDILIRASLRGLWEQALDEYTVGAVRDVSSNIEFSSIAAFLEVKGKTKFPYFNSGVLLVDVRKFRALKIKETCLQLISKYGNKLKCYDQDVLNIALLGQWKEMSWKWNFMVTLSFIGDLPMYRKISQPEEYSEPTVVHFIYKFKPWQSSYLGPFRDEFFRFYDGPIESSSWPSIAEKINWSLYELSTRLYYFRLSCIHQHRIELQYLRKILLLLVKKPWLCLLYPFYAVYHRAQRRL